MHLKSLFSLALLVAVPAAGSAATVDWPQPGLNAQHTGYNTKETTISAANIGSLTQKWAVPIPGGISGAPIELNGIAYAQSHDGTIYAVETSTGTTLWTYATGGAPTAQGITATGTKIYTTCRVDGNGHYGICALKAATGALVWSYAITNVGGQVPTSSYPDNVPVVDHGVVFFAEAYGGFDSPVSGDNVTALNAATGTVKWAIAESVTDKSGGLPFAIDNSTVFYQTGGANVFICAVSEADGSAKGCSAGLGATFAGSAALSASGGKVLCQNTNDSGNTLFTAFDETTLAVAWQQVVTGNTSGYSLYPPAVAAGLAYFYAGTNGSGSLYALSLKTGRQHWTYACNSTTGCLNSGVSVANGVLYASCDKEATPRGDQCAFNAKNGALLRRYGSTDGSSGTESTPLVANGAEIGACGAYGGNLCEFAP